MSSRNYYITSLVLFAIYFINGVIAIPTLSITNDESDHMSYAIRVLKMHPEKLSPFDDASTMPVSGVNALPRAAEQLVRPGLQKTDWGASDVFSGRYMTLLLSALIGFFLLKFATELYGRKAGLFVLFLFVFCPNINGHAVLVTTDAYAALFTLTSAWYFRKALLTGGWKNTLWFGIHLGLAQLAKQSLTHLYIIFLLLLVFYLLRRDVRVRIKPALGRMLAVILIVILMINIGFLFSGTGKALGEYNFRSSFFRRLQQNLAFAGSLPLPLPEPYLSGLDLTKNMDEIGPGHPESSGDVYLLGQYKSGEGFWYYYFVVLFFKTPIPVIVLFVWLLLTWIKQRRQFFLQDELIFAFVIVYFLIYFNFFYASQVGIRHIIMVYPLLYLLTGKIADRVLQKKLWAAILALYSVVGFYSYFPDLIAYSNEFLLPKRKAYKVMADSNIDYGQGYFFVEKYLKKHTDVRLADTIPAPGKQVVRLNAYLDLNRQHKYAWLRKFEPVSRVGHSYLLFDIKKEELGEQ